MPQVALALMMMPWRLLRLFCHRDYAQAYLGSVWAAPAALIHFLVMGERLGHLPNPFFDPAFFAAGAGTSSLVRYLSDRRLWTQATSERFDPAWYGRSFLISPSLNPLVDFWVRGFDKWIDPAPRFDMHFFREAVCRDQWNDRRYAFALFARSTWVVPTNADALRRSQDAFIASLAYRVVQALPQQRHSRLVFVQAGAAFTADFLKQPRNFDVLLNYYEAPPPRPPDVEIVVAQTGTKTTAIRLLLQRDPNLLLRYDAVLFLDDDITIETAQIEALFETASRHGLDLAQAALTAESECYFDCLKQPQAGTGLRSLNAVEIMMPLISRRALEAVGWVFGEGVSGWCVDALLGAKVRETFGTRVALIADVVVAHERPVDTTEGRFYAFLRRNGIDAATEAGHILRRFQLESPIISLAPEVVVDPAMLRAS